MKLPGLIFDLSLILILTPRTKGGWNIGFGVFQISLHVVWLLIHKKNGLVLNTGQEWDINVTRHIRAVRGSDVTIPCSFTYPSQYYTEDVKVYWKKNQRSEVKTDDLDVNAFVCHTNDTFVLEKYRGKTKLIGNKDKGNCTLVIQDIRENEPFIYVRVIASGNQNSFLKNSVRITLSGENFSNISLF